MVGQNIGKYQVLDRIGRGGMGTVYRAIDETLRREVAVKVLNAELNDPAVAKRFQAEAITVARLNHPGIATVYELFQNDGQWLMVMEFVRGETLEGLVTRKGPLPIDQAADISMQALGALAHAHNLGVVHRDLKPANLMLGDSGLVKIMDFGIARVAGTEHLTNAGFMMGTPAYMAPEQVLGEDIDARCDIYAMGAVLFYLLTGQLPFKGKSPFEMAQAHLRDEPILLRTLRLDMPEWAEQIIDRALQREVMKRFQNAPLFHDAIRRGLSGLPIEVAPAAPIPADLMVTAPPGGLTAIKPLTSTSGSAASTPPPELIETVLASSGMSVPQSSKSLPVPAPVAPAADPGSAAAPAATPAAGTTTGAATMPSPTPAGGPGPSTATAAPVRAPSGQASRGPQIFIAAGVVLAIAAGALFWMRGRDASPAPAVTSTAAQTPDVATAQVPAEDAGATAAGSPAMVTPEQGASPGTDLASSSVAPPDATASAVPSSPGATGQPSDSAATDTSARGTGVVAGRGTRTTPTGRSNAAGASAPGGTPVAAAPEVFQDVRLLVVSGKNADERPVTVRFGDGAIAAISARDNSTVSSIAEKDVSYAAYARAKDPRWSPVLASPPADTDFPGGLFRSSRHWLTLQSRSAFLIFRLNDADWRRVIDAVNRHTTVTVDTSPASK